MCKWLLFLFGVIVFLGMVLRMIIVLLLGNGVVIGNLEENSIVIFILNSFLF